MGFRKIIWVLVCLVFLSGCAWKEYVDRGDRYAADGMWEEALREYERADGENPDHAEILARIKEAQVHIAASQLGVARNAAGAGNFELAYTSLDEAEELQPDNRQIDVLRRRVTSKVVARAREHLARDEYGHAIKVLSVFYHVDGVDGEPEASSIRGEARRKWASVHREKAREADSAGDKAGGYVHWSMVASLAKDNESLSRKNVLRREILKQAGFRASVSVSGGGSARVVQSQASELVRHGLKIASLDTGRNLSGPGAMLKMDVRPMRCTQDYQSNANAVKYVSGTKQVESPNWRHRREEVWRLDDQLRRLEQGLQNDLKSLARAEEIQHRAENRVYGTQDVQEQARYRREANRCYDETLRARQKLLNTQRSILDFYQTVQRERRELSRLQPFVEEEVYSTFRYEVRDWERVCEIDWSASVFDERGRTMEVVHQSSLQIATRDKSHDSFVRVGISEDPLRFPLSDRQMQARLEKAVADEGLKLMLKQREHYHLKNLGMAREAESTRKAAWFYLVAYLTSPSNPGSPEAVFFKEQYGVEDPFVLTP